MAEYTDYQEEANLSQERFQELPQDVYPPQQEERETPEIGIIRELSQAKKVLEQVRMNLKGFFWDYSEKKYIRVEGMEPLMNDKGISKYLSIIAPFVSDLTTFSNYRLDEINQYILYICDKAIPTIHINYKEYGVKDKSDLEILDIQLLIYASGAFRKAVGAGDRNVVRGTVEEKMVSRTGYPQMQQRDKGFLNRINPFAKV
ncbi:MAG TPA: hypothetical protein VMV95_00495 [Bacillota bacterium]|nr:hypothetical protein [Bacillota bacterium]